MPRGHFRAPSGPATGAALSPKRLIHALDQLRTPTPTTATTPVRRRVQDELAHFVGRPSPIYHAERLSRELGGAQIYLKREDLNHTGAHKINNVIGQALLAKRMGKPRVIAETGAGQHGVATATICARYGMECVVYMGSGRRQAPGAQRLPHEACWRAVVPVESGSKTPEGRPQRGDARLGHQRREHLLHHRHRGRPAPLPDDGARLPARDRRRMPGRCPR